MKQFFDIVRKDLGSLSQTQVEGIELLVSRMSKLPIKHSAYILATAWHETAKTMQPIAEYGKGKGKKYGVPDPVTGQTYYGHGYVQLTWKDNYDKANKRLKQLGIISPSVDLVNNPDTAMQPLIASDILIIGMTEGWFTGKKLSDCTTYIEMRKIVNGTDKAALIASYAETFEKALATINLVPIVPDVPVTPSIPAPLPKNVEKSIAAWIIGIILVAFAAFGAWLTQGGN